MDYAEYFREFYDATPMPKSNTLDVYWTVHHCDN